MTRQEERGLGKSAVPKRSIVTGPGSAVRLKANNSLLSPANFAGYPSTLTPLGKAYESL